MLASLTPRQRAMFAAAAQNQMAAVSSENPSIAPQVGGGAGLEGARAIDDVAALALDFYRLILVLLNTLCVIAAHKRRSGHAW
jgi:hypothetical protein